MVFMHSVIGRLDDSLQRKRTVYCSAMALVYLTDAPSAQIEPVRHANRNGHPSACTRELLFTSEYSRRRVWKLSVLPHFSSLTRTGLYNLTVIQALTVVCVQNNLVC